MFACKIRQVKKSAVDCQQLVPLIAKIVDLHLKAVADNIIISLRSKNPSGAYLRFNQLKPLFVSLRMLNRPSSASLKKLHITRCWPPFSILNILAIK